jgi:hypothetical protein
LGDPHRVPKQDLRLVLIRCCRVDLRRSLPIHHQPIQPDARAEWCLPVPLPYFDISFPEPSITLPIYPPKQTANNERLPLLQQKRLREAVFIQ